MESKCFKLSGIIGVIIYRLLDSRSGKEYYKVISYILDGCNDDNKVITTDDKYKLVQKIVIEQHPYLTEVKDDIDRLIQMIRSSMDFHEDVQFAIDEWLQYWIDKYGEYLWLTRNKD
jgi:hypothetical protein